MNKKWSKRQLNALDKSIEHWKDNLKQLKEWDKKGLKIRSTTNSNEWKVANIRGCISYSGTTCELCDYYSDFSCNYCPLSIEGYDCSNSTWSKCRTSIGNDNIIKVTKDMLKTLIKVRKKRL